MRKVVVTLLFFAVALSASIENASAAQYVQTYQVSSGTDDGYSRGATSQDISGLLMIGDGNVSSPYYMSAMRFTNVNIPRSASVTSAVLKIQSTSQSLSGQIYGQIRSEASDDVADFSSRYIASASLNSASVNWDHSSAWSANTLYTSPDITSVVQPVLSRTGWVHNNDLAIFYRTRSNSNQTRSFASFNSSPAAAPVLEVTYQVYKISGHVRTLDGQPFAGAILTPSPDIEPTISDSTGYYELFVPPLWGSNLDISKPGWGFTPNNLYFSETTSDWNNIDFTAIQCHIYGTVKSNYGVPLSGIQILADGGYSGITNFYGQYDVVVPYGWTGTIRPIDNSWIFTNPGNRWLSNVITNVAGIDFTGYQPKISGYVRNLNGSGRQYVYLSNSFEATITDETGYYSMPVPNHWSGNIHPTIPSSPGWGFIPQSMDYNDVTADQPGQNYIIFQPLIKGTVKNSAGEPMSDVFINAGGPTRLTDADGHYEFNVTYGWSGTITATTPYWSFDPNPRVYSNLTTDLNDQNFTGRSVIISGYVSEPNGTAISGVIFQAPGCQIYFSDSNGYYWIRAPYNWSGTVSVYDTNTGWAFDPTNRTYANLTSDQPNQNYTGRRVIISGYVKEPNGVPVQSVAFTAPGGRTNYSYSSGIYWIQVPYNWSGTITPNKTGWGFAPPSRTYTNVISAHIDNENFTAFQPVIRGNITMLAGGPAWDVLVTASGAGSCTTGSDGFYEIKIPYGWSGTVTPNKTGLYLIPINKQYINVIEDQNGQNYTVHTNPYGQGSGTAHDPYQIVTPEAFYNIANHPEDFNKCFLQTADINLAQYAANQLKVIGSYTATPFTGVYDGSSHSISNVNLTGSVSNTGIFGYATGATALRNIVLVNPKVSGLDNVGALVGYIYSGTVENCSAVNLSVTGTSGYTGGLIGYSAYGAIFDCNTSGNVAGTYNTGGFVGFSYNQIDLCHSSCTVNGAAAYTGGFAGDSVNVSRCYSTGKVQGGDYTGGLVGFNSNYITQCYSISDVNGGTYVGGLTGNCASISDCYARGAVSGYNCVGGLTGDTRDSDTINRCFSTGLVTCPDNMTGGLSGCWYPASANNNYWDINTSGKSTSSRGTGKTTAEMKSASTYLGWGTRPAIWNIQQGIDYPHLLWEGLPGEDLFNQWYGGGSGEPNDPYIISTAQHFAAIGNIYEDFNKCFILTNDINLANYDSNQLKPIGLNSSQPFKGVFDGNGHTISNFKCTYSTINNVGLFGYVNNGIIKNIILNNANVSGQSANYVATLAGYLDGANSKVENCSTNNFVVSGTGSNIGGLVGYNNQGIIINCASSGSISGVSCIGGLVGYSLAAIRQSHSNCSVTGTGTCIGGLAGLGNEVNECFSTGTVQGANQVGGLTGGYFYNYGKTTKCYSTADVNGTNLVGGLTGCGGVITDCYARGTVRGAIYVGGLAGGCDGPSSKITRSYSTGSVTGTGSYVGGLVGYIYSAGSVQYGYWDVNTSGMTTSAEGLGRTTAQMKSASTYLGWKTDPSVWNIQNGIDYPHLLWEGLPGVAIFNQWYGGGSGDANDPYLISQPQQLGVIGQLVGDWGMHFRLNSDIDFSGFSGNSMTPIGDLTYPFTGEFDGAGHTISNLTIDSNGANFTGLFGFMTDGAQISCLGLIDPNIRGADEVGAIVGYKSGGTLTQCWVRGGIVSGNGYVGGLVGYNSGSIPVSNCYAQTTVDANSYAGGFTGGNYGTISNCFSSGYVAGTDQTGGFSGYNGGTISGCFWDIDTSGQSTSYGGIGKTTAQMKQSETFIGWACQVGWTINNGADYPRVTCENASGQPIDKQLANYLPGSGTAGDPYLVSDANGLNMIGLFDCEWDKHFKLTANIDMNGIPGNDYHIIGTSGKPFTGSINGNNHKISNFSCVTNSSYVGLFGYINDVNSRITNLRLVNPYIDAGSGSYVGSLIGYVAQGSVLDCSVENGLIYSQGGQYIGGLTGYFSGTGSLSGCSVIADVNGQITVGGLAGFISSASISDCTAQGNVTAQAIEAGGFAGRATFSNMSNCSSSGNVRAVASVAGGLIGFIFNPSGFDINNCQSNSVVASGSYAGGFAGRIICSRKGRISGCTSTAEVNVTGGNGAAGGFAGWSDANIIGCSISATVWGTDRIGGVCGTSSGTIVTSKFLGSVNGTTNVGGIVGYQDYTPNGPSAITDCYAEGQVSGISYVGGLVGYNKAPLTNSYSTCVITGTTYVGGLVGYPYSYPPPTNCVWDIEISEINKPCGYGNCEPYGNRGRTTAQMKSAYSYAAWVCDSNWIIDDGKDNPRLYWESQSGTTLMLAVYPKGTGGINDPFLIDQPEQLIAMGWANCLFSKNFALTTDLELSDYNLADFKPIGSGNKDSPAGGGGGVCFTGTFDGQGHIIYDFNFRPVLNNQQYYYSGNGLFGCISDVNAQVKNLGLVRPDINSVPARSQDNGTLVGYMSAGTISKCFSRDGNIAGVYGVGGLVGRLSLNYGNAQIIDSYSTTNVTATSAYAGGLLGYNQNGIIQRCYSTGIVSTPSSSKGGLIGAGGGTITASFWDINTSGLSTSASGTGLTTEQMKTYSYYGDAGWDFNDVWHICEPTNYPKLSWQLLSADYLCPDGVDFMDYTVLAQHWMQTDYGNCGGLDITGDGKVDLGEFVIMARYWQWPACGNCGGADYSHDHRVNSADLAILCDNWLVTDYGDVGGAELTGDGIVNIDDLLVFSSDWLKEI